MMLRTKAVLACLLTLALAPAAMAQVPANIASQLKAIGPVIEVGKTGAMYAPMQRKPPYDGVQVVRDLHYAPGDKEMLDVFAPAKRAGGLKPVVLFVHGGAFAGGDKSSDNKGQLTPYYDNIMLWAVANGMVGVNFNYPLAPGATYPKVQQDIAAAIVWAQQNAARYGGDGKRIYLFGHSAGATHVAAYIADPKFYPKGKVGLRGAILSSGVFGLNDGPSATYGADIYFGPQANLAELSSGGLAKAAVPLLVNNAELDPVDIFGNGAALNRKLCAAGHCPTFVSVKGHNHLSEMFAFNTADVSLSGPTLAFIRSH